ncbi:hypothetical protein SK128_015311 [Halocaridina rubra]|uniref:Methyltransferase FkbM domain-containing protein n=1 Tax=Halocaridina rubra TaxID=373956 RepID=A0AAN9AAQ6_HALRR
MISTNDKHDEGDTYFLYRIRGPLPSDDDRLLNLVRREYLYPPSNLAYNLSKWDDPTYKKFSKEDTWRYIHFYLVKLFSDSKPGFFVEAGALDGEYLSNTLWLEQYVGWTGLLVEPDKESFRHLQNKHRKSWTSNTCLSNQPYPKETVHVSLHLKDNKDIMRVPWNFYANAHEYGVTVKIPKPDFFSLTDESYTKVQCFPLSTFLMVLNVSVVDFLSLDIQGGEKEILRNIPWDKIRIRTIVVECIEKNIDESFVSFMESKGYVLVNRDLAVKVYDYFYVRKDEETLIRKLQNFVVV